jgi:RimJ/RimL family protein N-acetyltransferase
MLVRRLVSQDAPEYRTLRLAALRESPASFGSSYEEERDRPLGEFAALVGDPGERAFFGAFSDAQLVGSVGFGRESSLKERHKGFIRGMYVVPLARGQGIGRALLARALDFAATIPDLQQVTLAVNANNVPAIRLYKAAGFEPYGLEPMALFVGGTYHDELHMVRTQNAV